MQGDAHATHPLMLEAERLTHIFRQTVRAHRPPAPHDGYWHFRPYQDGEAATLIDWRQSARTDKLIVRERETEAVQTLCLWLERSPDLFDQRALLDEAYALMLALGRLKLEDGDRLMWLDSALPSTMIGAGGFGAFAAPLLPPCVSSDTLPPLSPVPRRAQLVLCSRFREKDLETWQARIRLFTTFQPQLVFLHLLLPDEEPAQTVTAWLHKTGGFYLSHRAASPVSETFAALCAALEAKR